MAERIFNHTLQSSDHLRGSPPESYARSHPIKWVSRLIRAWGSEMVMGRSRKEFRSSLVHRVVKLRWQIYIVDQTEDQLEWSHKPRAWHTLKFDGKKYAKPVIEVCRFPRVPNSSHEIEDCCCTFWMIQTRSRKPHNSAVFEVVMLLTKPVWTWLGHLASLDQFWNSRPENVQLKTPYLVQAKSKWSPNPIISLLSCPSLLPPDVQIWRKQSLHFSK